MRSAPAPTPLHAEVMERLNRVQDPCSVAAGRPMGLVDMGLIKQVDITGPGDVTVYLRLTSPACYLMTFLKRESVREVSSCVGVTSVEVHPDEGLDWSPQLIAPTALRLTGREAPVPQAVDIALHQVAE
ncbi:metal-sulfur cluster assembly factor [Streptomyces sp. NPDC057636]|uniref:metal-sulfur cluster assembly factor n=1 Tax=Streptomyces sp. NPDC057636 TaxID=3346189 RepID=UPI00369CCE6A